MDEDTRRMLEDHEKRIAQLESMFRAKPASVKKQTSLGELIASRRPESDPDKALVVGYFPEDQGLSSFDAKDLEEG